MSNSRTVRWWALWLALVGLTHAWSSALVRPAFQISDELAYFADVQSAAGPASVGFAPLSPADRVLDRPLAKGGAKPLFGAVLAPVHRALRARLPAADALVALRMVIALAVPLAVICTFVLARCLFPGNLVVMLGAPLLVAQQPVFIAYAAGVTPDALANLFAALSCLGMARLVRGGTAWDGALAAGAAVVAFLFKDPAAGLLPGLAVCVGRWAWIRTRAASRRTRAFAATLGGIALAAIVAVAWTGRLPMKTDYGARFIGDALGAITNRGTGNWFWHAVVPQWPSLIHSFWAHLGNFGVSTAWLPDQVFAWIGAALSMAAAGVVMLAVSRPAWLSRGHWPAARTFTVATCVMVGTLALLPQVRQLLLVEQVYDQGRWLYSAMAPIAVLVCAGLTWPLRRPGRIAILAWFVLVDAVALTGMFLVLIPYHYEVFPWAMRASSLYLRSGPVAVELVQPYVLRPEWLLGGATLPVVLGAWVTLQAIGLGALARRAWLPPVEENA